MIIYTPQNHSMKPQIPWFDIIRALLVTSHFDVQRLWALSFLPQATLDRTGDWELTGDAWAGVSRIAVLLFLKKYAWGFPKMGVARGAHSYGGFSINNIAIVSVCTNGCSYLLDNPFLVDFPLLCQFVTSELLNDLLVGGWATPLKNMSQLGLSFPRYRKNVPNHQPWWGFLRMGVPVSTPEIIFFVWNPQTVIGYPGIRHLCKPETAMTWAIHMSMSWNMLKELAVPWNYQCGKHAKQC